MFIKGEKGGKVGGEGDRGGISGMYVRDGGLWTWCGKKEGHMMTESW